MKKLILLLLLVGCSSSHPPSDNNNQDPPDPPVIHDQCTDFESEDNSSLETADFIGHLGSTDRYFICGETDPIDTDNFWVFPDEDINLYIELVSTDSTACMLQIFKVNFEEVEGEFVYTYDHLNGFTGDLGLLVILGWPLAYSEYGYIFSVSSFDLTEYQMEVWNF